MKPKGAHHLPSGSRRRVLARSAGRIAGRNGFSVIELLVAMVLLLVITAVFGRFFQRSTQSWESGMRTVEVMIMGRAAVNMIARDIERAITDASLDEPVISAAGSEMSLTVLSTRDPYRWQRVRYYLEGSDLKRETEDPLRNPPMEDSILIENVHSVVFDDERFANDGAIDLPQWISIRLTLRSRYDAEGDTSRLLDFVGRVHPVHYLRYPDTGAEEE